MRFFSCFTARKESRTLTYLSQQMITILKLSQMHENHLHADVHRCYMYCNLEWLANCFPALTDPVPTHQRYHSDFSSSSESPSVTSSDPDYGQGSKIDWNIHQSTSLLKERMGCMKLYKLYIWLYIQYIWYRAWCLYLRKIVMCWLSHGFFELCYFFSTNNKHVLCGCVFTSNTAMSPLGKKLAEVRRYGSQMALTSDQDALSLTSHDTHRVR